MLRYRFVDHAVSAMWPQFGRGEVEGGLPVRESADNARAPPDLT